jgi:uncharacterized RDD family membrane protein YckC
LLIFFEIVIIYKCETTKQRFRVGEMGEVQQLDVGHWVLRLIALVIDAIIIGVIASILWSFIFVSMLVTGVLFGYGYPLIFPLIVGVLMVLYFAFFEVNWEGATLGKRLLGLKVQTTDGGKIGYDKSIIRNISKIYWILLLLDWIVAIATPGDDRRQKYTDRIAGTTVVQVSKAFESVTSATT